MALKNGIISPFFSIQVIITNENLSFGWKTNDYQTAMDKPLTTADIPERFLRDAFLVGHVPLTALASDPRISYALYIPPQHYRSTGAPLPLLVWVHGTGRNISAIHGEDLVSFADSTPCAVVAPLFPAGLAGPHELDSYKVLQSPALRSDFALLSILDEISHRWPGVQTEKIFLMGFSGGGQFAHRFLYLYPERLVAISVGAPGRVTALDNKQEWPRGVGDVETRFGRSIDKQNIQNVAIQLIVGSIDDQVHGGSDFQEWLQQYAERRKDQPSQSSTLPIMRRGRLQTLRNLQSEWKEYGIEAQLDVVDGVGHNFPGVLQYVLQFIGPAIQNFCQKGCELDIPYVRNLEY